MKNTRRLRLLGLSICIAVLLALWGTKPQATQPFSTPADLAPRESIFHSDADTIREAWTLAQQSGVYRFRTTVEQTTFPAPRLTNVGRSSQTDRFVMQGQVDRPQDRIEMTVQRQL